MAGTTPQPLPEPAPEAGHPSLHVVEPRAELSRWRQPRDAEGSYVAIERRALPALTSLRFFAAAFVVVHHLINVGLLATQGADADRTATWYLAWGTQGHVGVTFFFVLSGFILAWCYHHAFATVDAARLRATARRFWFARFARVWPLHAAMFLVALPIALVGVLGDGVRGLVTVAWQGAANVLLLHAWLPVGDPQDGLAQTFNGPSWTLSCEAFFYAAFPLLAVLVLRRLRWGTAQLAIAATSSWLLLGALGLALDGAPRGHWLMHVFPGTRVVDFVVGVALGLAVVQHLQRARLAQARRDPSRRTWTIVEGGVLLAAAASPLAWANWAHRFLPETLGSSWFHLPVMTLAIGTMALERGAISRGLLAWRPLLWLGEASYALYLTHMVLLVAAYRAGAYDLLGAWPATLLLAASALLVAGIVHERFEKPVRERLVSRRASRAAAP